MVLRNGDSRYVSPSVSAYETTWRHKPEEQHPYQDNLISTPIGQVRTLHEDRNIRSGDKAFELGSK